MQINSRGKWGWKWKTDGRRKNFFIEFICFHFNLLTLFVFSFNWIINLMRNKRHGIIYTHKIEAKQTQTIEIFSRLHTQMLERWANAWTFRILWLYYHGTSHDNLIAQFWKFIFRKNQGRMASCGGAANTTAAVG